jgi:hypothetical protein
VVSSRDSSQYGSLLLVIGKALSSEIGASTLRNLDYDGRFDVPVSDDGIISQIKIR